MRGDFLTQLFPQIQQPAMGTEALKSAKSAAEDFAKAVFDRIEFIRTNGVRA